MKKIIVLLLIAFSFGQELFMHKDITISIDNSMQSIDINNYIPLVSGYYKVEPLFADSFSSTSESMTASFIWNVNEFWSEFAVDYQCNCCDNYGNIVCDMSVHDQATISVQNSILNIMWPDNVTASFDLVLRVSGIFDDDWMGINDDSNNIYGYSLDKPYPNPFNPNTTISFTIPIYDFVSIKVYDVMGRLVSTLAEENFNSGTHTLIWNGENYSSGEYFIKMESSNYNKTQIVTLIK